MKPTFIINDIHEDVQRTGGTTDASAAALRDYIHDRHQSLFERAIDEGYQRVIVNGDLADTYSISLGRALDIYQLACDFLDSEDDYELVWGLGNHDLSKDSSKLGTVAFIGALLERQYPKRFRLVSQPTLLGDGIYMIPHLVNQATFDAALEAVPDGTKYLLLHCNFDNNFAVQQDHSLNLSRDMAKTLKRRGITMVLGHEHQHRTALGSALIIVGNQIPSSVSDCLEKDGAQSDGKKYALGLHDGGPRQIPVWSVDYDTGFYQEIDWQDLANARAGQGFIRVSGKAEAAQAADVIRAISGLRSKSQAFVITNAVKVESVAGMEDLSDSVEDIRNLNVLEMLLELLEPEQQAAVKALLAGEPA